MSTPSTPDSNSPTGDAPGAGTSPDSPQALPEKPRGSRKGLIITAAVVVAAIIAAVVVWATQRNSSPEAATAGGSPAAATTTVRIGTTEAGAKFWPILIRKAADQGITIKKVDFSDYNQPNRALSQGQIDLNYFQHIFFLANYNVENHDNLIPLASTYIVPLSIYSKKHTAISQIPAGAKVAIPNDDTNQGRALLLLQKAGLLKLKDGGSPLSTPADVLADQSKVSVTAVDASQTVTALPSVAASVINNGFALDAKLDPESALASDDPNSSESAPYINIFAARANDKDNATYLKVAQLWHDPEVTKTVTEESQNTAEIVTGKSQADLQTALDKLQTEIEHK